MKVNQKIPEKINIQRVELSFWSHVSLFLSVQ